MALPNREYYYLQEVAKRWSISELDLQYYIENGLLQAGVLIRNVMIEYGQYVDETSCPTWFDKRYITGIYFLLPENLHTLFRKNIAQIQYLKSYSPNESYKISNDGSITINLCDIVITEQACTEFEKKNNTDAIPASPDFKYYNNYQEVVLNGDMFKLGAIQSNAVQLLHNAYLEGHKWIHGKEILRRINSASSRISDVFKSQKNWRKLIMSDGRGYYCLNIEQQT